MESKPWYASTTVWGGIIAAVSPLIGVIFHVNLASEATAISDALAALGAGIGGLIAVYGRTKASTTIGTGTGK